MSPVIAPVARATSATRTRNRRVLQQGHPKQPLNPVAAAELGLGALFAHTRDAVVVGNVETGTIALWNPAAERLFGYTPSEALGQPIGMIMPPAIGRLHDAALSHYRRGGSGALVESRSPIDVAAITRAGDEIHVELSLVPLDTPPGRGRFVLAILRDSEDRRRAETQALELARATTARVEAEGTLRACGELIDGALQELERPLTRLRRSIARLAASGNRDQAIRARLACVVELRTEAVRLAVTRLRDRAAMESGHMQLDVQRINLVPLLTRIVTAARRRSTANRLTLSMPQGLTVVGDSRRIEQTITDLLDYAVQRSPRRAFIDIDLRRPLAGLARLEVRDYGGSLSQEDHERLLEANSPESSLYAARALLEQHGGTLSVEQPPDGGLRLVATLPAHRGGGIRLAKAVG